MSDLKEIIQNVNKGSIKDLRKLLTNISTLNENEENYFFELYKKSTATKIFGLLGTPGAGKSTFLNKLLDFKKTDLMNEKWAVLLIDPSNPYNQGAILGDRVRLSEHYLTPNVFIRSISNQSQVSGIPHSLAKILMGLSIFGFDRIFIESVGGGQSTIGLKDYCDHLVLIFDPGSGDGIQHLKSGALDVADSIIISKSDLFSSELIKLSLTESIARDNIEIHSFSKDSKIGSIATSFFKKMSGSSKKKICQKYLSDFVGEFFEKKLNVFSGDYFKSHSIPDYSPQEFIKKFKFFFYS